MTNDEKLDKILETLARMEKRQAEMDTRQQAIKAGVQEHDAGSFGATDFGEKKE